VRVMLGYEDPIICAPQASWIASLPLSILGDDAKDVYEWIYDHVEPGFIPLDNRRLVLGK